MKKIVWTVAALIVIFLVVTIVASNKYSDGGELVLRNQLKSDTYGGQTPAETLQMLVEALRNEDLELASKYFVLSDDGNRDEWLSLLEKLQEKGGLDDLINKLEQAQPYTKDISHKGDFKFFIPNDKENIETVINLEKNSSSGVWKIENL
jgi:hypothetical protein